MFDHVGLLFNRPPGAAGCLPRCAAAATDTASRRSATFTFKKVANGKLVRRNSWTSHRLHQKSKKHKRKDHTEQPVSKADRKTVRRALVK